MGRIIGFIPARSGSQRIQDKNITMLRGNPLLSYTVNAAIESKILDAVFCITDSKEYMDIACCYGASPFELRPSEISSSHSPDIEWLLWALELLPEKSPNDTVVILRPTSPLRSSNLIRAVVEKFLRLKNRVDSVRTVSPVTEHPGKMWRMTGDVMVPLLPFSNELAPWHSSQKISLPEVFIQNACIEVSDVESVLRTKSIAGNVVAPYKMTGLEAFDLNEPIDLLFMEFLVQEGQIYLEEPVCRNGPQF